MRMTNTNSNNPLNLKWLSCNNDSLLLSPPSDIENKTSMELELLESVGKHIKEEDKETIEKYKNYIDVYYNIMDQFSLQYDKIKIKELVEDVNKIVSYEKYRHNRKRPVVVAKKQKIDIFEGVELDSDSSYPSRYAAESMFLSLYLSDKFPLYKEVFMETTKKISNSRLMSLSNYPTDILAGHTLSYILYNKYKEGIDE